MAGVPEEVLPGVMGVEQLLQVILEDPGSAKSNSRLSRISLEDVKRVAASRGMASSRFSKSKAVDAIVESVRLEQETKTAIQASASGALQKNRNVVARIINCIMNCGTQVEQLMAISTRVQLQSNKINENSDFIAEVTDLFNNIAYDSGGLVFDHPLLKERKVDPEFVRGTDRDKFVPATRIQIWTWLKELRTGYSTILPKFTLSGQHQMRCITAFCKGGINDVDMLYLHLWIQKKGNPDLNSYFAEGADLNGEIGFDSAGEKKEIQAASTLATPESESGPSKKRKRNGEDSSFLKAVELLNAQADKESERMVAEWSKMSSILGSPMIATVPNTMGHLPGKPSIMELHTILSSLEKEISEMESYSTFDRERPPFGYTKKIARWEAINLQLEANLKET